MERERQESLDASLGVAQQPVLHTAYYSQGNRSKSSMHGVTRGLR
jgi:hypothetical protein